MVALSHIDSAMLRLEEAMETNQYQQLIDQLSKEHPSYLRYLTDNEDRVLTQVEQELLLFCGLAIWLSFEQEVSGNDATMQEVDWDDLIEAEESHWETLEKAPKSKHFSDRITSFFENNSQEELFAFIEDILSDDDEAEEQDVSPIGREPMFVVLASAVQAFEKATRTID